MFGILALVTFIGMPFVLVVFDFGDFGIVEGMIWLLLSSTFLWLDRYFNMSRKPVLSTKARLVRKNAVGARGGTLYNAWFLLPNKRTKGFDISEEQFRLLKINDVVELVHKGYTCISFQRPTDKAPIMNNEFRVKQKKSK